MDVSPTRRRTLQLGAAGVAAGVAGCLGGDDDAELMVDFGGISEIDDGALPDRTEYRADEPFPKYRLYEAENPDIALILLHTAAFDSRMLEPLARALAEANVAHVFTPDLRGHGPDPETRGDIAARSQLEADVSYLIEHVETRFDDVEVVVGGHGTGGGVVVRFASTAAGERADGFLLLAPYLGRDEETMRPAMGGWADFFGDRIFLLQVTTGFGLDWYLDMTTVEYEIPDGVWDGSETLAHTYRLMEAYTPPEEATEQLIDRPMLTVVGTDDETVYPDSYEEPLGSEDSQSVEQIDGASYFDLTVTETAVDTLEAWIDETTFERRGREGWN